MKIIVYIVLLITFLFSCTDANQDKKIENKNSQKNDNTSTHTNSSISNTSSKIIIKSDSILNQKSEKRVTISGDFNGDGEKEKLVEHYISQITKKETNKTFENVIEYSELVDLIAKKKPQSYIVSSNLEIDTLHISSNPHLFGVLFLRNEGDLNNDGKDEVSYVVDWADWSALNTYHIVTFHNGKWIEIASFPIWEWQLDELKDNQGLIKKLKNSEIECYYQNAEAELDTMILKLNKHLN